MPDILPEYGPDADEDLPEEVVDAIEWGTPAVRAVRLWRELSILDLSKSTAIDIVRLVELERGQKPTAEERTVLAKALEVGAGLFVE
jgi:hypothetical protein